MRWVAALFAAGVLGAVSASGCSGQAGGARPFPAIPIGSDALVRWDHWPTLRLATRTIMRGTYDRTGGNDASDASHFIREEPGFFVPLDLMGSGVLTFVRTNHWHGSPWHYVVDGRDNVVSESTTADPDHPLPGPAFSPANAFPPPLAVTWQEAMGSDLSWTPIAFTSSLELGYGRSHYGTGYFVVQLLPEGSDDTSRPLTSWTANDAPDPAAVDVLRHAGEDIAPTGGGVTTRSGVVDVPALGSVDVVTLNEGPAVVRAVTFEIASGDAAAFAKARLQVRWDERALPSIDAPLGLFFGTGSLFNRGSVEYLVKSFPMTIQFARDTAAVRFATYFPMPFERTARITITSAGTAVPGVKWSVRTVAATEPSNWVGYFHATYTDHDRGVPGRDLVLLDTASSEGGGDWCGSFVGTSFTFSDQAGLQTLEGDPRFFFDDSQTPQAQGTGTEEWGGGGDYWGGRNVTLPLAGHPVGAPSPAEAMSAEDAIESAYRFLLPDLMPFGKNARIQLEHGGTNESVEHYTSVAYWYGHPGACLRLTDTLHVGDANNEAAHGYRAIGASNVVTSSSRYEWGVDHRNGESSGAEIFPESSDTGRTIADSSEFTLRIAPDNEGVLLRRKLDYGIADQLADVFVADDTPGAAFVRAGTWYLAGSSRTVFADAATETGEAARAVRESNRRWRDDELLIRRALTTGRKSIRIRIVVRRLGKPLLPRGPVPLAAWSEFRYSAYVWSLPSLP